MAIPKPCIYKITNKITDDVYIGSTCYFRMRKNSHLFDLRHQKHGNRNLQMAFNAYGEYSFVFSIVELLTDRSIIIEREQFYLDTLKPAYNIYTIADRATGVKRSSEFSEKQKLLHNRKGKKLSPEQCLKMSQVRKDCMTPKEKERLRSMALGNTYRRGKKMTKETIVKMSGENSGCAKLTAIQVDEIRQKYIPRKYSSYTLAREYKVGRQTINHIINKTTWRL